MTGVRLAALVIATLAIASPAAAARPCWKVVLADWFSDLKFDRSYSCACYRSALEHVPRFDDSAMARAVAEQARASCQRPRAHPGPN
jgi:hypothetical protein